MHEFLGIILGAGIGSGLAMIRPRRRQGILLLVPSLAAGVLATAVNGELHAPFWPIFVTFDTLLAGLGGLLGALLAPRQLRRPALTRSTHA